MPHPHGTVDEQVHADYFSVTRLLWSAHASPEALWKYQGDTRFIQSLAEELPKMDIGDDLATWFLCGEPNAIGMSDSEARHPHQPILDVSSSG